MAAVQVTVGDSTRVHLVNWTLFPRGWHPSLGDRHATRWAIGVMSDTGQLPPVKRRRVFAFSLRSFLLLLTVFCIWLGIQVDRVRKQRVAIAAIEEIGGGVWYDYQYDEFGKVRLMAKPPAPEWLRQIIGDDFFVSVVGVTFADTRFRETPATDAHLEHVIQFRELQWLIASGTRVTDIGMKHLKGLTRLELLYLNGTGITDVGLLHLAQLTELQELHVGSGKLHSVTLNNTVTLNGTQVTDAGLKYLKTLKKLKRLNVAGSRVTHVGAKELKKAIPKLEISW